MFVTADESKNETRTRVEETDTVAGIGGLRLVGGDRSERALKRAFERDYRESYPMIYNFVLRRVANREVAEDIVSDTFLHAARAYAEFDPTRAKFSTWVISISRNCISDYFRREQVTADIDDVPEGSFATVEDYGEQTSDQDEVLRLLQELDDEERELVYLKYYEGKRNVEIAEALGMNASTISTKLARAMAKMRAAAR